jgi:hypothetical protein
MTKNAKMMWGCVAVVAVVLVVASASGAYVLLFALPCLLMMGAMLWMMGSMGGRSSGGDQR